MFLPLRQLLPCAVIVSIVSLQPHVTVAQPMIVPAESRESAIVNGAASVLNDVMQIPARSIPQGLLARAEGVAIIPSVVKGGFVVGVRRGHGVVLVRDEQNRWHAPQFITLTGGSVGFQAGLQATDVILVFRTRRSIEGLRDGRELHLVPRTRDSKVEGHSLRRIDLDIRLG